MPPDGGWPALSGCPGPLQDRRFARDGFSEDGGSDAGSPARSRGGRRTARVVRHLPRSSACDRRIQIRGERGVHRGPVLPRGRGRSQRVQETSTPGWSTEERLGRQDPSPKAKMGWGTQEGRKERVLEHSLRLSIRRNVKYGEGIPERRAWRNQTIKCCRFIWTKEQICKPLVFGHNLTQTGAESVEPPTCMFTINLHPPGNALCWLPGATPMFPLKTQGKNPKQESEVTLSYLPPPRTSQIGRPEGPKQAKCSGPHAHRTP